MVGEHDFEHATAVGRVPDHPGRWLASVPASWATGHGMHGGVLATVLLRAARAELDDPELVLRSVHVSFRAAPTSFDLLIEPVIARRGGLTAHVDVTGRSPDQAEPAAVVRALFARPRPGETYLDAEPPMAPPIHELATLPGEAPGAGILPRPPIAEHLEFIGVEGTFPWEPDWRPGPARHVRWNRYREPLTTTIDGTIDSLMLVPVADFPAAAVWVRFGPDEPRYMVTSLELTLHLLEAPRADTVLTDIRARSMGDGYVMTETDLWCADRLVATSSQMMLVRRLDPATPSPPVPPS